MGRFHFSLAGLGAAMALLCVHLAAWISRWPVSGAISGALLYALSGLAICGAVVCRDERRPFWTGVAVFGFAFCYSSLTQVSSSPMYSPMTSFYGYQPNTQQTNEMDQLLDLIESQMGNGFRVGDRVMAIWRSGGWYSGVITADHGDGSFDVKWDDGSPIQQTSSSQIRSLTWRSRMAGRALLGTLFAFAGGIASAVLFGPKKEAKVIPPAKQTEDKPAEKTEPGATKG